MDKLLKKSLRAAVFCLAVILGGFPLPGYSRPQSIPSPSFDVVFSRPAVQKGGAVCYVFRSPEGIWSIASSQASPDQPAAALLRLDAEYDDLRVIGDTGGRLWLAGEERTAAGGMIRIGRLENRAFGDSRLIGVPDGWNDGMDLCFPGSADPWIAWRHRSDKVDEILVEDTASGRRWRITPGGTSALSPPRICPDARGGLWVLWTGRVGGDYVVAGRYYNGFFWSEETRIAQNGERPCLQLDAALGKDGILRAAWSAYDGNFYKIRTAACRNGGWSEVRTLSDDAETEGYPRLVDLDNGTPAVVWVSSDISNSRILAAIFDDRRPVEPFIVSENAGSLPFEAVGTDKGLFLIDENSAGRRFEFLQTGLLRNRPYSGEKEKNDLRPQTSRPAGSAAVASLSESKYVGFGDSITFGYMYSQEHPELGYIPRLDVRLDAVFGPTDVINEGIPGELTPHGLGRIDTVLSDSMARYILVMEGTNDVKIIRDPIEVAIYNLGQICKHSLAAGTMPILSTVIPRNDWIWNYLKYRARHNTLNAGIRALPLALVIPFVDMETAFLNAGGAAKLISDGVHPNEEGYVVMTNTWYAGVRALPFRPTDLRIRVKGRVAAWDSPFFQRRLQNDSAYGSVSVARQSGCFLSWQANPKTADISSLKGYRIYRKKRGEGAEKFVRIGEVSVICAFLDRNVTTTDAFDYVVTAVAKSGVEGARSETVSNY
ncbi:MAG: GDSL-type esterase/lipase family protein [Candidatus Aminicenantes bacterium]|nr:GDSL-type esterase/lipase family protein [Candidatus Aminicenantes bacterium]